MLSYLRDRPWGIRLLAFAGFFISVPIYLWKSREELAFMYKILWRGFSTGGVV